MKKTLAAVFIFLILLPSAAFCASRSLPLKEPYTFVVLGDNRSGDRVYKKIVKLVVARNPDFIVNTGDVIPNPGNRNQWKNFWELSKPFKVPYFLVVGNHDVDDRKSEAVWKDEVNLPGNELYYSWTVGRSLFAVLNSCEVNNDKKITGMQLAWLKRTLDPDKYDHQFVFLHHPLYLRRGATHYGESLDEYPKERDALQALLIEKKADAVFAGHEHAYYKKKVDDLWHIITGGAGAPLYRPAFNHFVFVKVDGPRIEIKVIDKEGVMRDEFMLR